MSAPSPDLEPLHRQARAELERLGLLLESDARLPSIVGLVAGEPVRGSWWGHPRGDDIYLVCERLADQPDVLRLKLVNGKVTYVARRLWNAVLAAALAQADVARRRLSAVSSRLLEEIEHDGVVVLAAAGVGADRRAAARELESHGLALAGSVHTASGAHARKLTAWRRWAHDVGLDPDAPMSTSAARAALSAACAALDGRGGAARLPEGWDDGGERMLDRQRGVGRSDGDGRRRTARRTDGSRSDSRRASQ